MMNQRVRRTCVQYLSLVEMRVRTSAFRENDNVHSYNIYLTTIFVQQQQLFSFLQPWRVHPPCGDHEGRFVELHAQVMRRTAATTSSRNMAVTVSRRPEPVATHTPRSLCYRTDHFCYHRGSVNHPELSGSPSNLSVLARRLYL